MDSPYIAITLYDLVPVMNFYAINKVYIELRDRLTVTVNTLCPNRSTAQGSRTAAEDDKGTC